MLYAIVALLIIILDQWTKYWVAGNIVTNSGIKELIPRLISLVNIHNEGAAFGFLAGSNARILFVGIAGVFALFVIIALATNLVKGQLGRWSLIFVMAGGIGNCIDRLLYGYVQDMFKLDFVIFAIFNVADAFITIGCILFILYLLFGGGKRARRRAEAEEDYDEDEDEEVYDDEDEDEEEEPRLTRKERAAQAKAEKAAAAERERAEKAAQKAEKSGRAKARRPQYEQDYEQFKAARAARQQEAPAPAPAPKAAPAADPSDPFAEWERANARVAAQNGRPVQPTQPVRQAPVQQPVVQQPVQPAPAPAPQPAPRPAAPAAPAAEEFSLEDILNEFK